MIILDTYIPMMQSHADAIHSLTANISDEQAHWKPDPDSWSVLEVLCHLYDEECLDFRLRLEVILYHPGQVWQPIDPKGWVASHQYNEQDLAQTVSRFLAEREKSQTWLKALASPDWQVSYQAAWGPVTAGDMISAWVAHDLLHLRQLVELHYAYLTQDAQPYRLVYAGEW